MNFQSLYQDIYSRFFERKGNGRGYDFQHAPTGSVPPPKVSFGERLKWWTWNRRRRLKRIIEERDRQQQDILKLKKNKGP